MKTSIRPVYELARDVVAGTETLATPHNDGFLVITRHFSSKLLPHTFLSAAQVANVDNYSKFVFIGNYELND